jgi:hypothetical protein
MLTEEAAHMLWREGRLANAAGRARLPSPHRPGSDLERAWLDGWDAAEAGKMTPIPTPIETER